MSTDNFMIGFVMLLVSVFASRTINDRANKNLDQTKKAELIDLFANVRILNFAVLIAIVVLFYLSIRFELVDPTIAWIAYFVSISAYIIVNGISAYRKLKLNGFSDSYIKSYLIATSVRVLGIVIFFAIVRF